MKMNDLGMFLKHGEMKQRLAQYRENLRASDNGPGDLDERPSYVEMGDGVTSLKARIFSDGFVERTESPNEISIFSGTIPGFGGVVQATEVRRLGTSYSGKTLVHDQNGSIWPGTGFAFYREEHLNDSRSEFVRLESMFRKKS